MTGLLRPTLGPAARTVAIGRLVGSGPPEILDNAATIARRTLQLADPFEDMGAMIVRHLVWRVFERAGDGTATAAVIAQALMREAARYIAAGGDVQAVRRGIAEATRTDFCAPPASVNFGTAARARSCAVRGTAGNSTCAPASRGSIRRGSWCDAMTSRSNLARNYSLSPALRPAWRDCSPDRTWRKPSPYRWNSATCWSRSAEKQAAGTSSPANQTTEVATA